MKKIFAFLAGLLFVLPAFGQSSGGVVSPVKFGSYVGTIVGCTTSPTVTILYTVVGKPTGGMVVIRSSPNSCTSNSTNLTITGAPAAIRPAGGTTMSLGAVDGCGFNDNGVSQCSTGISVAMDNTGTLTFSRAGNFGAGWTAAGNKAVGVFIFTYPLQ